jgi:predicted transcriptional regulator
MSDFQTMQARLSRTKLKDLGPVSIKTGVPVPTLYKIARGETKNPRVHTVEKITKYYRENP